MVNYTQLDPVRRGIWMTDYDVINELSLEDGTIRLWPTDPIKSYGLWQKVDEPVEWKKYRLLCADERRSEDPF